MFSNIKGNAPEHSSNAQASATRQTETYISPRTPNSPYIPPHRLPRSSDFIQSAMDTNAGEGLHSQMPSNRDGDNSYSGGSISRSSSSDNSSLLPLLPLHNRPGHANLPANSYYYSGTENNCLKNFRLEAFLRRQEENVNAARNTPLPENENEPSGKDDEVTGTSTTATNTPPQPYVSSIYKSSLDPTWADVIDESNGFGIGHTPSHDDLLFIEHWYWKRQFLRRVKWLERTRCIAIGSLDNNQIKRRLRCFTFENSNSDPSHDVGMNDRLKSFLESRKAARESEALREIRREFLVNSTEDGVDTAEGLVGRKPWSRVVGSRL